MTVSRVSLPVKHLMVIVSLAWPAMTAVKAAEPLPKKPIVDFEATEGIKLTPAQAKSELVTIEGNSVLQITTQAAGS